MIFVDSNIPMYLVGARILTKQTPNGFWIAPSLTENRW